MAYATGEGTVGDTARRGARGTARLVFNGGTTDNTIKSPVTGCKDGNTRLIGPFWPGFSRDAPAADPRMVNPAAAGNPHTQTVP